MSRAKQAAGEERAAEYSRQPESCQPRPRRAVDGWSNFVQRFVVRPNIFQHVLAPPTCVLCGDAGQVPGFDLCVQCETDLPVNATACVICAEPLSASTQYGDPQPMTDPACPTASQGSARPHLICGRCQKHPPRFHACFCPYLYAYPIDHLVRGLKYQGALAEGRVLGELLARQLLKHSRPRMPDCLIPVPLGTRRYRVRGYNQAVELTLPIQQHCNIPVRTDLVERTRETQEQAALDRSTRRKNLRGAFATTGKLRMRHVAIVDDVVTTGSTVNELARVLRRAGVELVEVWAIARAGRGS